MVTIRWTGTAGVEFSKGDKIVLIDPFLSRPGKFESFFGHPEPKPGLIDRYLEKLPGRISAIIAGHTHFDHVLDIPELVKHLDCPVIGSASLEALMTLHGKPGMVTVCKGGERIELPGGVAVIMLRSRHGLVFFGKVPYTGDIDPENRLPMRARDYRVGDVFMPKLEMGGVVFMHAGSANFIESEVEGHRCDVLFMGVPGWKKIPEYCSRLPEILQPQIIIPFHYDDFFSPLPEDGRVRTLPFQDMPGFIKKVSESTPRAEIRMIRPFEPLTL
jgi:L-ascorbate metabolism protein UlaG (beta-lactamase superfamily)